MPLLRAAGLAMAFLSWLVPGPVIAQTTPDATARPAEAPELARAKVETVWLIADARDETAVTAAMDLAAVFGETAGLRVLPVLGDGAAQTVADILYLKGIDVGIVQEDTLHQLKSSGAIPQIADRIRTIAKLYTEELHVIAGAEVKRIADLAGKKVNFDAPGSGTALTARRVFEALGVAVEAVHMPQELAIRRIRSGEIAASVMMTGAAARSLVDISPSAGLRLVPVPYPPALRDIYLPAQFTPETYPGLVEPYAPVDTIAVGTVMVVFNWQKGTQRFARVARFADIFFSRLDALRRPGRHGKWREVNLAASHTGWEKFAPVKEWLEQNRGRTAGALEREFKSFLSTRGPAPPGARLRPGEREALFREFVRWREKKAAPASSVQ